MTPSPGINASANKYILTEGGVEVYRDFSGGEGRSKTK
jgi:hypothetical protein